MSQHLERFVFDFCTDHVAVRRALGRSPARSHTPCRRPQHPRAWQSPRSRSPALDNFRDPLHELLDANLRKKGFDVDYDAAAKTLDSQRTKELGNIRRQIQEERDYRQRVSQRQELKRILLQVEEGEIVGRRSVYRKFLQSLRSIKLDKLLDALGAVEDEEYSCRRELVKHALRRLDETKAKERRKWQHLLEKLERKKSERKPTNSPSRLSHHASHTSHAPMTFRSEPRVNLGVSLNPLHRNYQELNVRGAPIPLSEDNDEDDEPIYPQTISQKKRPDQVRFVDHEDHVTELPSPPQPEEAPEPVAPSAHLETASRSSSSVPDRGLDESSSVNPQDALAAFEDVLTDEDAQRQFLKRMEVIERRVLQEDMTVDAGARITLQNRSISQSVVAERDASFVSQSDSQPSPPRSYPPVAHSASLPLVAESTFLEDNSSSSSFEELVSAHDGGTPSQKSPSIKSNASSDKLRPRLPPSVVKEPEYPLDSTALDSAMTSEVAVREFIPTSPYADSQLPTTSPESEATPSPNKVPNPLPDAKNAIGSRTDKPFLGLSLVEITGELNSAPSSMQTSSVSTSWTSSSYTTDESPLSTTRPGETSVDAQRLGLVVNAKFVGGPGDLAGIEVGDIVVGVAGKRVKTFEDVRTILLERARLGEKLPFHVVRPAISQPSGNESTQSNPSALDVLVQILTTDPAFADQPSVFFDVTRADRVCRDGTVEKATRSQK